MNLIVAADKNWGIGYQGKLLANIPEDLRMFREETMGKVVVMGRKTLESLPGGQPLAKRTNIILSRDPDFTVKGAIVCRSVEEALKACEGYADEDIFIAGGETIYRQFLPCCDIAHVTALDYAYQADTFFPNLDEDPDWVLAAEGDEQTCFDLCYTFRMYCRKNAVKKAVRMIQGR